MFYEFLKFFSLDSKPQTFIEMLVQNGDLKIHSYDSVSDETFKQLLHYLTQPEQNSAEYQNRCLELYSYIESHEFTWVEKLKFLSILHRLSFTIGYKFCQELMNHKLHELSSKSSSLTIPRPLKFDNSSTNQWILQVVGDHYLNYLHRLSLSYDLYKICRNDGELPTKEDFQTDYKLKFMWMFKISNQLNYLLRIQQPFTLLISKLEDYTFFQQIISLILADCIYLFNVLSREISRLLDQYLRLTSNDALLFYELFSETYRFNYCIQDFYEISDKLDFNLISVKPLYLETSKDTLKEIQIYYNKVQTLNETSQILKNDVKKGLSVEQAIQILNFQEQNSEEQTIKQDSQHPEKGLKQHQQEQLQLNANEIALEIDLEDDLKKSPQSNVFQECGLIQNFENLISEQQHHADQFNHNHDLDFSKNQNELDKIDHTHGHLIQSMEATIMDNQSTLFMAEDRLLVKSPNQEEIQQRIADQLNFQQEKEENKKPESGEKNRQQKSPQKIEKIVKQQTEVKTDESQDDIEGQGQEIAGIYQKQNSPINDLRESQTFNIKIDMEIEKKSPQEGIEEQKNTDELSSDYISPGQFKFENQSQLYNFSAIHDQQQILNNNSTLFQNNGNFSQTEQPVVPESSNIETKVAVQSIGDAVNEKIINGLDNNIKPQPSNTSNQQLDPPVQLEDQVIEPTSEINETNLIPPTHSSSSEPPAINVPPSENQDEDEFPPFEEDPFDNQTNQKIKNETEVNQQIQGNGEQQIEIDNNQEKIIEDGAHGE